MKSRKRSSLTLTAFLTLSLHLVAIGSFPTPASANPVGITSLAGIVSSTGNYVLTANIVVSGAPAGGARTYITDIFGGTLNGIFGGTLNGNGFTISGLEAPLFRVVSGSISNINLSTSISGIARTNQGNDTGILAGRLNQGGSVTNANVTGSISVVGGVSTGGLIGQASNGSTISNSSASVQISDENSEQTGGLVGFLEGGGTISGSTSSGTVTTSVFSYGTGGLVGYMGYADATALVTNSASSSAVSSAQEYVGGLIGTVDGRSASSGDRCIVKNSSASGSVTASAGDAVGGLIGGATDKVSISNVTSSGQVTAPNSDHVGGLIGYSDAAVSNSSATGNVSGRDKVGGLIGFSEGTTTNSRARGNTIGSSNVGALIGSGPAQVSTPSSETTDLDLLNEGADDAWRQNQNINSGMPYILALIDRGFYLVTTSQITAPVVTEAEARAAVAQAVAKREAEVKTAREDIANKLASTQALTIDSFKQAEIAGVTAENFAEVQAEILALPIESRTDIKEVLKVARKFEVVGKIASEQLVTLPASILIEVGLIPADGKNKASLISAIRRADPKDRDSYKEIQAIIAVEQSVITARKDRLAAIKARVMTRSKG